MESDFLTSPADIYPNRKVELEDAEICEKTRESFTQLCDRYDDIFSKNNQDIGKTTLIEMEMEIEHWRQFTSSTKSVHLTIETL